MIILIITKHYNQVIYTVVNHLTSFYPAEYYKQDRCLHSNSHYYSGRNNILEKYYCGKLLLTKQMTWIVLANLP